MASFFGKQELTGAWKERFQDVNKLNEYMQRGNKTEISDAIIKDVALKGAIIDNASFRNVDWNNTVIQNGATITNTVFRDNTFNDATFARSTLTNVTFEDSEFNGIDFVSSQMTGVKFIRCKFTAYSKVRFVALKNSTVEFDHVTFESEGHGPIKIEFHDSTATLSFRDSTLTDVSLTDLALPSSLTFTNSKLQSVDMDRSKLTKLVMENVTGENGNGFNGGSVAETEVRNSEVQLGLQEGTLGKVTFINSKIKSNFGSSNIKELRVINCKAMVHLRFYKSRIDTLEISNSPVNELNTIEAVIQSISIEKSAIVNSDFSDMKAKNLTLTDVTFDQKNDFTGAHVEHLHTKNVTKLPGLNLILTGSNVKFQLLTAPRIQDTCQPANPHPAAIFKAMP